MIMDRQTVAFASFNLVFIALFYICSRFYLHRRHQRRIAQLRIADEALGRLLRYIERELESRAAVRGLEPAVVDSVPTFLYPSKAAPEHQLNLECAVCLSEFKENECLRLLPKCGHFFHLECVDKWFISGTTCPVCRTEVEAVVIEDPSMTAEPAEEEIVLGPGEPVGEEIVLGLGEPIEEENGLEPGSGLDSGPCPVDKD
ncbi:hypothetical protein ABFS83_14G007700 [Erythranthe nasuta]